MIGCRLEVSAFAYFVPRISVIITLAYAQGHRSTSTGLHFEDHHSGTATYDIRSYRIMFYCYTKSMFFFVFAAYSDYSLHLFETLTISRK